MNGIYVRLPLPPKELSKNGRVHHMVRARLYREHREWACRAVQAELATSADTPLWQGRVSCDIEWVAKRPPFPDESACIERVQAYIDGAQDAGLFVNDTQVSGYTVRRMWDPKKPSVGLTFTHLITSHVLEQESAS